MIDSRNILLISGVLLIVAIFGFWLPYEQSQNVPIPNNSVGTPNVVVAYTAHGFDPATITVAVGTTVAWKNESGAPLWVASDPHPSHTDLPGFDELRISSFFPSLVRTASAHESGIYSYTFTKVGSWRYHNHLNPRDRGTITVIEK